MDARRFRTGVAALVVAAGLTGSALSSPAVAATDGMQLGAYVAPRSGESDRTAVTRMETRTGRKLAVVREFVQWNETFPDSYHNWVKSGGRTLILSVKSNRTNGQVVRWADVANAQPGSTLHNDIVRWADRMKAWGAPIYFAFNHEPEAGTNTSKGNAADYIAAFRKIATVFDERGVTNAKMIWIMTDYSFFVSTSDRRYATKWYPGDAYVDAMGADAYNWYNCRPGIQTAWWTLERIIKPFRDFGAQHPGKELWLTEVGSAEDSARPGRKATWINEARALFKRSDYSQFQGVSWFDRSHGQGTTCVWYTDSSTTSQASWVAMGTDPFYRKGLTP